MKFREHRGGFEESMATVREIDLFEELWELLESLYGDFETISFDHRGRDERNGWDTYYVCITKKRGEPMVVGMSDGQFSNLDQNN